MVRSTHSCAWLRSCDARLPDVPRPTCRNSHEAAPVGHADEEDVVERVHAVNLGEELVDNGVMDAAAAGDAAALLADGVYLIEYDDMQVRGLAPGSLLILRILAAA
jgi:hypothetical protein